MSRQVRVGLGIPRVVIDAVEHPAEPVLMLLEGATEPESAVIVERLIGVMRGDRGHEIRIQDAALHRVQPAIAEIIPQPADAHSDATITTYIAQPPGGTRGSWRPVP